MTARQRIVTALLIGAVGLAFADASVVALALPDLYGEFDTTITGVSWVLITYALVVVPLEMALGLLLAVIVNAKIKGQTFFRAAFYAPAIASSAAITVLFIFVMQPQGLFSGAREALVARDVPKERQQVVHRQPGPQLPEGKPLTSGAAASGTIVCTTRSSYTCSIVIDWCPSTPDTNRSTGAGSEV